MNKPTISEIKMLIFSHSSKKDMLSTRNTPKTKSKNEIQNHIPKTKISKKKIILEFEKQVFFKK